ncbi:MAG: HAD family phosphatase [Deferribacteres bacterium]|nr:HAD family phosphatase [candidate division KSB1 bacterium]MCB9502273.1 HAD family phosphatase [Deferribacteres bacterium]
MKIKNILFDFDGVIADSEFFQLKIWGEILAEEGFAISELGISAIAGIADELAIQNLFPGQNEAIYRTLVRKKKQRCEERSQEIAPVQGMREFLNTYHSTRAFYICSNSHAREIRHFTQSHFPDIPFQKILGRGDFSNQKPDPAPYLKLMELTGITPAESIVIEDSAAGVKAAQAAGLTVIYFDRYGLKIPKVKAVVSLDALIAEGII